MEKKFECDKCGTVIKIETIRALKAHSKRRTNYPFGKNSKSRTTLTHSDCGGILTELDPKRQFKKKGVKK